MWPLELPESTYIAKWFTAVCLGVKLLETYEMIAAVIVLSDEKMVPSL
jgi:hypothetical protein